MVTVGEFNLRKYSSSPHLMLPTIKVEWDATGCGYQQVAQSSVHQKYGRVIHVGIRVIHLLHHVFRESRHSR